MKRIKRFFMTVSAVILLAVLLTTVFAGLALSPESIDVFTAEPSVKLPMDVVKNALVSGNCTLSEDELNAFLAYLIENYQAGASKRSFRLTDLYIDLNEDIPCKVYMRISNGTLTASASADVDVTFGDELTLKLSNISIGKLPVADSLASGLFSGIDLGAAGKYADEASLTVKLPTHYGLDIPNIGQVVNIDIKSIVITDDSISVTTNSILGDFLLPDSVIAGS